MRSSAPGVPTSSPASHDIQPQLSPHASGRTMGDGAATRGSFVLTPDDIDAPHLASLVEQYHGPWRSHRPAVPAARVAQVRPPPPRPPPPPDEISDGPLAARAVCHSSDVRHPSGGGGDDEGPAVRFCVLPRPFPGVTFTASPRVPIFAGEAVVDRPAGVRAVRRSASAPRSRPGARAAEEARGSRRRRLNSG